MYNVFSKVPSSPWMMMVVVMMVFKVGWTPGGRAVCLGDRTF